MAFGIVDVDPVCMGDYPRPGLPQLGMGRERVQMVFVVGVLRGAGLVGIGCSWNEMVLQA